MKVIFEDANVKISLSQREGENACVCFTGVGHALGGIDVQREEFTKLKEGLINARLPAESLFSSKKSYSMAI